MPYLSHDAELEYLIVQAEKNMIVPSRHIMVVDFSEVVGWAVRRNFVHQTNDDKDEINALMTLLVDHHHNQSYQFFYFASLYPDLYYQRSFTLQDVMDSLRDKFSQSLMSFQEDQGFDVLGLYERPHTNIEFIRMMDTSYGAIAITSSWCYCNNLDIRKTSNANR